MASTLAARLEKLEARVAPPEANRRCWSVVCNKGDEEAATELAKSRGFDPDNESHYLIMRSIVTPAGQDVKRFEPYIR